MSENAETRADTFLWAIRIFKSRTLAGEAFKAGKVKLNDKNIKPSHNVKIGEIYTIRISSQQKKTIEVVGIIDKRGSFDVAKQYYIDHSPALEKIKKEDKAGFVMNIKHEKGTGRPTKRNRRDLGKEGGWF